MRFAACVAACLFVLVPSLSRGADAPPKETLDGLLSGEAECVKMETIRPLVAHEQKLNAAQFDFIRGMWMVLPPPSTDLPIGDQAEIITDGDTFGVVLIDSDSDEACARFHVPSAKVADFLTVINAVGEGMKPKARDKAGDGL